MVEFFIPAVIIRVCYLMTFVVSSPEHNTVFLSKTLGSRGEDLGLVLRVAFTIGVRERTDCWHC
jgi:hypothetical protein